GKPSVNKINRYREMIVPSRKAGPFFLQQPGRIRDAVANADVVVAMFDLRWPAYLMASGRGRYILWGHRYSQSRIANVARDWLMKKADRILLYGPEEIEQMVARGIDPARIEVAHNTIHVPNHNDYSAHR